jgi:predicted P-loop ATPase
VFQPGCKADGTLILEGIQGAGKSTAAKILAGQDFFGDNLPPMTSKEASAYVRGRWIIEMAELANVTKAEVEVVKAFISRTEERFRPPYGRNEVCYPRQCVFIGSTNRTDYLRDDTGNRRFWPVAVGKVRLKELEADRNMLWGEAVVRYKAGEQWWLSAEGERIAQAEQADRLIEDPWTSDVLDKVAGKSEVTVTQVLADMTIDTGRRDRLMSNRIVSILMQNGWVRHGRMTRDPYKGQNRFVRVDQLPLKQDVSLKEVLTSGPAPGEDDLF